MSEDWRIAEQRHMNEWAESVLKHDREKIQKPKLRCKLFGHHWFTHILVPGIGSFNGPGSRRRTICMRCKVNKAYAK